jgi:hypothetical protein
MFDRETRRTRLLETRSRLKHDKQIRSISLRSDEELIQELEQSTDQFWSIITKEKKVLQEYIKQFDEEFK